MSLQVLQNSSRHIGVDVSQDSRPDLQQEPKLRIVAVAPDRAAIVPNLKLHGAISILWRWPSFGWRSMGHEASLFAALEAQRSRPCLGGSARAAHGAAR